MHEAKIQVSILNPFEFLQGGDVCGVGARQRHWHVEPGDRVPRAL
jgi:hypothetical protein